MVSDQDYPDCNCLGFLVYGSGNNTPFPLILTEYVCVYITGKEAIQDVFCSFHS